ncbi:uncharacterized protein LOC133465277 [Phyllopteryx taeniolatus]|uniref:uncharacterized protein LOC133465277 n=1 Tax=Phyllopteryx taeniolatus TaxID=161469 RepID=UPI002AD59EAB|nr:uncharacterized protein LOC133465277 [Phyllopteryx taeniolatus]
MFRGCWSGAGWHPPGSPALAAGGGGGAPLSLLRPASSSTLRSLRPAVVASSSSRGGAGRSPAGSGKLCSVRLIKSLLLFLSACLVRVRHSASSFSIRYTKSSPACLSDHLGCSGPVFWKLLPSTESLSYLFPKSCTTLILSQLPPHGSLLCLCLPNFPPHHQSHLTHQHPMLFSHTLPYHYLTVGNLLQITSSAQDVIHLCASTSALVGHPMFVPLLEKSVHYSHLHPCCKVYHHLSLQVPFLDPVLTHHFFITPITFTNMSITICTNYDSLSVWDAQNYFI